MSNFDTWQDSAHANSVNSQLFRRCLEDYLEKKQTNSGTYCFDCHAPGEVISGNAFIATSDVLKGRTHRGGVTCITCHSVESVVNGKAVYDPGDTHGYHSVTDLQSIKREALCLSCHGTYTSTHSTKKVIEPGFFAGLIASISGVVSTKSGAQTDHLFTESVVANEGHWACPDISFSHSPVEAPTEGQHQ